VRGDIERVKEGGSARDRNEEALEEMKGVVGRKCCLRPYEEL